MQASLITRCVAPAMLLLGVAMGHLPTAEAADAELRSVVIEGADEQTVTIELSSPVEGRAVSSIALSSPERLVVEVPGATGATPANVPGLGGLVQELGTDLVRDGADDLLRITLHLSQPVDHLLGVSGDQIAVSLSPRLAAAQAPSLDRPLSGPALPPGAPPTVASLDMENLDEATRIIVGLNKDVNYTASRPETNLLVLDFPGATLAGGLERPLDASHFISPVRMVRAYRTTGGTRLAVNLKHGADYRIQEAGGNLLHLDVLMPERMKADRELARQSFSAAAPSTPGSSGGEGLRSAYQEEVLIDGSGRTSKPQAVFGAGAGASDPSSLMGMATGFMFDRSSAGSTGYSGQRLNIDLVNADIHSVFRLISNVSKLNIVAGDDVVGRVTVRLENVPWDQAFAAILQAKGLGSQRFGNIVRIAPINTIKQEQQAALEAKRASDELEELQVYVVPLNYASARGLVDQVAAVLSARGTVEVDTRSNQLIVEDTQKHVAKVRELIRQLDKSNPSILIEARVVEANSKYTRGLGIQWGGQLNASPSTGFGTGSFFPSSVGASGGLTTAGAETFYSPGQSNLLADLSSPHGELAALAFSLGSVANLIDLDARLGAMESEGWGKIVSSPRVTTTDNELAVIRQGQRIPYLSTSAGGTQVKFIDASLQLEVTPHLTTDGEISLEISVENNRADFSLTVMGQPAIQIKEAQTSVLVKDGETTVIGGVYAAEESALREGVPFLSKIPILGMLFRNSGKSTSRNELLVFITPRVLSTAVTDGN